MRMLNERWVVMEEERPPEDGAPSATPDEDPESNADEEFYAQLSDEFDGEGSASEDEPEREPAPQPPPEESPPPAEEPPTPEPPVETPPSPPMDYAEPDAPQGPTDEQIAQSVAKWSQDLEEFYRGQMDDELTAQIVTDPKAAMPRLLAQATQVATKNAFQMMSNLVPQMAQQIAQSTIDSTVAKRAFFRKNPELTGHEREFDRFLSVYRQIPQNARKPVAELAQEAAAIFRMQRGIAQQRAPQPAPIAAPPPPPPSTGVGQAPTQSDNFWSQFADQILEEDL